ncbi:hypothetical protein KC853_02355 [Candidatus Saccharibacteria bacterium]|nr:hypothetical protein [Candidatus Saccharibacteria bacterium]MCB9834898.1 hypothetical protein [Candidatus Nomurabacteria bacterium]
MGEVRNEGEYPPSSNSLLGNLVEYYDGYPPTLWIPEKCRDLSLAKIQEAEGLITIMHTLDPNEPNKKLLLTSHLPERFLSTGQFIKHDGRVYTLPTVLVYQRHGAPCTANGTEYDEVYLNPTTSNTLRHKGNRKIGPYFINSANTNGKQKLYLITGTTAKVTPKFLDRIANQVLALE